MQDVMAMELRELALQALNAAATIRTTLGDDAVAQKLEEDAGRYWDQADTYEGAVSEASERRSPNGAHPASDSSLDTSLDHQFIEPSGSPQLAAMSAEEQEVLTSHSPTKILSNFAREGSCVAIILGRQKKEGTRHVIQMIEGSTRRAFEDAAVGQVDEEIKTKLSNAGQVYVGSLLRGEQIIDIAFVDGGHVLLTPTSPVLFQIEDRRTSNIIEEMMQDALARERIVDGAIPQQSVRDIMCANTIA